MNVQRLAPRHAASYRELMLEGYERHPTAFTTWARERQGLPLAWWERRLSADADAAERVFGALQDNGELAGVAGLSFEARDKVRHKATLFGMYVPPRFRHLGLGRRLVLSALRHARELPQLRIVQLTVTEGNDAARTLYERCGFVAFGVEPYAVAVGQQYFAKVHMWCDLRTASPESPPPPEDAGAR